MAKNILDEEFERKKYIAWLNVIPHLSAKLKIHLIEEFGSAQAIYEADDSTLIESEYVDLTILSAINEARKKSPDQIYQSILNDDIDIVSVEDSEYPVLLREIPDKPYVLYYTGHLCAPTKPAVGIVGARMSTNYGKQIAYELGRSLGERGFNIVSGMALGIDSSSHKGALDGSGFTTAVLGCGVNICYPPRNRKLYNDIRSRGVILSEYPPYTQALPAYFPLRNRIISGISSVLAVTEARIKSGSLITCNLAISYGRDVYALPGRITDPLSNGTNHLISQGALVLESVESLCQELEERFHASGSNISKTSLSNIIECELTYEENQIYTLIDYYAIHIDDIYSKSPIPEEKIQIVLECLKSKGKINEIFPDYYVRV